MAYDIEKAYGIGRQAAKLGSAAFARTLTNNPAAQVVADLEDEAAATVALLGGNGTTAVVTNGASVAVLDGTGSPITGATAVVAGGVLTVQLPAA